MFDLNLLGKPGIQPDEVEAVISFKPAEVDKPPVLNPQKEKPAVLKSKVPKLVPVVAVVLIAIFAAIIHYAPEKPESAPVKKETTVLEDLDTFISVFSKMPGNTVLQKILISPDVLHFKLFSRDQLALNLLGMELDDQFSSTVRISGNQTVGSLLILTKEWSYQATPVKDVNQFRSLLMKIGVEEYLLGDSEIFTVLDDEQLMDLMRELHAVKLLYCKQLNVEITEDGQYSFKLSFVPGT